MPETSITKLNIDEDFKRLIPPLSAEERKQLEENILRDGCRDPLCVWGDTILDGHNRYEICTHHSIPFSVQYLAFRSREEAMAWICANQLGRRNISDETRKYLIGKRYEMEKSLGAHNAYGTNQFQKKEVRPKMLVEPSFDRTACRTSERLGEEYHVSHATIDKYGAYAHAIDSLSNVVPELVPRVLSGEVKISHDNIVALSRLSGPDARRLSQHIFEDGCTGYSNLRKVLRKKLVKSKRPRIPIPSVSVKDMPAYDPDAEISSLALTVPSWISSIDRTRSVANLRSISDQARQKLENELMGLKTAIETMLMAIKEEN